MRNSREKVGGIGAQFLVHRNVFPLGNWRIEIWALSPKVNVSSR